MFKKVNLKQWIWFIALLIFAVVATLIFYILFIAGVVSFDPSYVTTLIGLIYLLVGWIVPNRFEIKYRKENAQYAGELPEEIKNKKFLYRFPLMSAALITLILSVIFFYIL